MTPPRIPLPRETATLAGHEAAERAFLDAWRAGRVPHAWLIAGSEGIGKATLAYRIARFVLAGGTGDSLAVPVEHQAARLVAAGSHPDLMVLQPGMIHPETKKLTRLIVVPHLREAIAFCHRTPGLGAWRALLIDPADAMNRAAANALLKVLEEPPPRCLILLTSNAPGWLLATIRSRCRLLRLRALEPDAVRAVVDGLWPGAPDAEAAIRLAEGSVGRALDLLAAGAAGVQREVETLLRGPPLDLPALHALADRVGRASRAKDEDDDEDKDKDKDKDQRRTDPFPLALDLLADHARRAAIAGAGARGAVESWLAVWDKIGRLKACAEASSLDRKLVLLDAFMAIERAWGRA